MTLVEDRPRTSGGGGGGRPPRGGGGFGGGSGRHSGSDREPDDDDPKRLSADEVAALREVDAKVSPAHLAIAATAPLTEDEPADDTRWVPYAWLRLLNGKLMQLANAREEFARTRRNVGTHFLIVEAPVRHGKQTRVDEPILTVDGWRTVGDLMPGDEVFGPDGKPVKVRVVSPVDVAAPKMRVAFSDGTAIDVHPNHEWTLWCRSGTTHRWRTMETQHLARRKLRVSGRYLFQLPPRPAVEFPTADLPIDPYLVGVWLGDGNTTKNLVCTGGADEEAFLTAVAESGVVPHRRYVHKTTGVRYFAFRELSVAARTAAGILNIKRVPDLYLTSSVDQRRALLQGIVDSDGSVDKAGRTRVVGHDERLMRDVLLLARSLGHRAQLSTQVDTREPRLLNGRMIQCDGKRWIVNWTPHDGQPQGRYPRKQVIRKRTPDRVGVVSVEPAPPADGVCIEVDREDGLFLVGRGLIPTHNSLLGSVYLPAWWLGTFPNDKVILTGNNAELAEGFSRQVRDIIRNHGARLFRNEAIGVAFDSSSVARWDMAKPYRGGLIAVGVGSPPTGKGGHLIVVDDPIKPLAVDCPVPTPSGWSTMGELRVGDEVFDHAGRPCRVVNVTERWTAPRNRVWLSDGTFVDSHPKHLWKALNRSDQAVYTHRNTTYGEQWPRWSSRTDWGKGEAKVREVTTDEIAGSLIARGTMRNWTIPTALPLELPERPLPIDPYLLGYWLGDGNSREPRFTVHKSDLESFEAHVGAAGYRVLRRTEVRGTFDVSVTIDGPHFDRLRGRLRKLGLLQNKHVPVEYLRASAAQRLALLRGLMDSDGGMGNGQVVFCSTEKRLADAVRELIFSLGGKASVRPRPAAAKTAWIVSGSPPFQPFALPRKAEQWNPKGQIRRVNRTVTHVEVLDECEHLCITVDSPDHLFLAGTGMVPTRNSDEQAYSTAYRESLWRWWQFSIRSRLEPGGVCIIIMSRWHEDDLIGRLLKRQREADHQEDIMRRRAARGELSEEELEAIDQKPEDVVDRWEVLHLPALAEPTRAEIEQYANEMRAASELVEQKLRDGEITEQELFDKDNWRDQLGRLPGQPLCPQRYDRDTLLKLRDGPLGVGPIAFSALYQNNPASAKGELIDVEKFKYVAELPLDPKIKWVRAWDLAATEKEQYRGDPDWTAGCLFGRTPGGYLYIGDMRRCRRNSGSVDDPTTVESFMRSTAFEDQARLGRRIKISVPQDPGAAGKITVAHYKREVLAGFDVTGDPERGDKVARATPWANQVKAGNVTLVEGDWLYDFLEECRSFPKGEHDDQVDAASRAHNELAGLLRSKASIIA